MQTPFAEVLIYDHMRTRHNMYAIGSEITEVWANNFNAVAFWATNLPTK
jgi:hypothetical protein